jgi:hypothetical protein
MVQLKHFGDDRDFFKYDLITFILNEASLSNYVFIPMLTEHRNDNEGQKSPADRHDRSHELLQFMRGCPSKSLRHWKNWISRFVGQYITVEPVDSTFFHDSNRMTYWEKFNAMLTEKNALIFIDPDTGLETGSLSYQKRQGREKYLLNNELSHLVGRMDNTSVLMIYQHLSRDRNYHDAGVQKKIVQAEKAAPGDVLVCAYRENDLAFLFVMKTQEQYREVFGILNAYHEKSAAVHKSIYGSSPPKKTSAPQILSTDTNMENESLDNEEQEKWALKVDVMNNLEKNLDYKDLRKALEKVLYRRFYDNAYTRNSIIMEYTPDGKVTSTHVRMSSKVAEELVSDYLDKFTDYELFRILWDNMRISPVATYKYLHYSLSWENQKLIYDQLSRIYDLEYRSQYAILFVTFISYILYVWAVIQIRPATDAWLTYPTIAMMVAMCIITDNIMKSDADPIMNRDPDDRPMFVLHPLPKKHEYIMNPLHKAENLREKRSLRFDFRNPGEIG